MIIEFVRYWDLHKDNLYNYFITNEIDEYEFNYVDIVQLLIKLVINCKENDYKFSESITIIDDGHYQGTQIFIVHRDTYQPEVNDYYYTHNEYGSCSGCDTLLAILADNKKEDKVEGLMTLSLHLLQRFKQLKNE